MGRGGREEGGCLGEEGRELVLQQGNVAVLPPVGRRRVGRLGGSRLKAKKDAVAAIPTSLVTGAVSLFMDERAKAVSSVVSSCKAR